DLRALERGMAGVWCLTPPRLHRAHPCYTAGVDGALKNSRKLHSRLHTFTVLKNKSNSSNHMRVESTDSKSGEVHSSCGFDPHLGHQDFERRSWLSLLPNVTKSDRSNPRKPIN